MPGIERRRRPSTTTLRVLTAGTLPPNPGEFIDSARGREGAGRSRTAGRSRPDRLRAAARDRRRARARLEGRRTDSRHATEHRSPADARELERALDGCQARPLGIVVTGAKAAAAYGYAYGYEYVPRRAAGAAQGGCAAPLTNRNSGRERRARRAVGWRRACRRRCRRQSQDDSKTASNHPRSAEHRRGWVTRRALLVADMLGLTVAFVAALVVGGTGDSAATSLGASARRSSSRSACRSG